ncbi:bifunctional diaminohydroxyphosphoribosylaminopyrimidine deaminase/5-amino-6-(5-phosphoribosylamino)uracil reductase RibD [Photobacterium sp. GB-50]|uniref:bifunctional diaminohydroxyphosphoribosylaminopyrimidine deaminase/5-amino-6-(5-phosphoribosylamino)uracil reductase RibD n=1 Tax=Photobacterium sp. GB-50 TaxID=2022107 RepID=UPI000D15EDF5|nr:bifunctional diaminohydroxyphosphoribosylaminopyrimidine deaminase/5-amino-6-(5-phosphoribosylamino)uracil reductase RibD [Photobacterium sp. GB-50]PSW75563.1 bifunctional diaminohydroxyphosphoribosylaminopyrimidine deaminase/5-amino-6-(5-phosphoribosylamino)uracil reductase RibD [Photobacterium sp. GB-50]
MFTNLDTRLMLRAIQLAKRGCFTTAPNPKVGCVIANGDEILGEGFHFRAGESHAEVFALKQAGARAKGATAYVTLEPCSHYGRTPPCAEALIKSGVSRVICAMVDPNPLVAGCGVEMLQKAGVDVQVGLLKEEAQAINKAFIKQMTTKMPYVELKLASSLDGKTALANGESKWITGPYARADVQRHRAQAGAILSTSATVIADDPSLNVRWSELGTQIQDEYLQADVRQPIRVIIDSQNRLTPAYQLFHLPGETILARAEIGNEDWPDSVSQWIIPTRENSQQLDLTLLMRKLAENGINHIWVEAGAGLAGGLLEAQLVDCLILYQAPKLMGADSRSLMNLSPLTAMDQVIDLNITDLRMVDCDVKITATVKRC